MPIYAFVQAMLMIWIFRDQVFALLFVTDSWSFECLILHTQKSFLDLVTLNQIWIVFTLY